MASRYIYALVCPILCDVRYVGVATDLDKRFRQHCRLSENGNPKRHVCRWLRSLIQRGLVPTIIALESTDDWDSAERDWIAYFKASGAKLTNIADGGVSVGHANRAPRSHTKRGMGESHRMLIQMACAARSNRRMGYIESADRIDRKREYVTNYLRELRAKHGDSIIDAIDARLRARHGRQLA